jgi:nickel superoxide dismutase
VNNKESHADELSEIVTFYFMAQRVKPAKADDAKAHAKYVNQVVLLHKMLVSAMKAKQTTDLAHVKALREHLEAFKTAYLGKKGAAKKHKHEHGPAHSH